MKLLFNALAASAAFLALNSSAAVLVQYSFTTSLAPTTVDPDVTASNVGQTGLAGMSVSGGRLNIPASNIDNTTAASSDDFISFTVTPDTGLQLDLSSLTFDIGRVFTGGYSANYAVFSSVDSFGTSLSTATLSDPSGTLSGVSVDLSAPAFQGLSGITFRIAFGDNNNGAGNTVLLDNLTLNGAVVPEPHEYAALAGLGLLGFAAWRRARRA